MPHLIDELTSITNFESQFKYSRLKTLTHYFYEDGTQIKAKADIKDFAKELKHKLNEDEQAVINHLKKSEFYFNTTASLFLYQSLNFLKNFINFRTIKGLLRIPKLNLFNTMNDQNFKAFKNEKTVQLFNRYATYNGSNPYKASALLNIIPHLEFGLGAYLPEHGMHQITEHLYAMALVKGVTFKFNTLVKKIELKNNRAIGILSNDQFYESDYVISDADINFVYKDLLKENKPPQKILNQEKSSSAYVFYFGIKKIFNELDLHNIFFSANYKEEFKSIFEEDKPYHDPTIYINITSKYCIKDAPSNCENWFVMINVPHNKTRAPIKYGNELRKNVIAKINRILKINLEEFIEEEFVLDPHGIENETSSFGGSLYGNASNNKFAAFNRHPNFSGKLKGLYFVGGSVHPGGGIPLCLMSAKIVADLILERKK